jgi:DNA segregation ATPase FtsK/SpoIIIE, S-DNA-T family
VVALLEGAAAAMDQHCRRLRGTTRTSSPTTATPLVVILIDGLATLTAVPGGDFCREGVDLSLARGK